MVQQDEPITAHYKLSCVETGWEAGNMIELPLSGKEKHVLIDVFFVPEINTFGTAPNRYYDIVNPDAKFAVTISAIDSSNNVVFNHNIVATNKEFNDKINQEIFYLEMYSLGISKIIINTTKQEGDLSETMLSIFLTKY